MLITLVPDTQLVVIARVLMPPLGVPAEVALEPPEAPGAGVVEPSCLVVTNVIEDEGPVVGGVHVQALLGDTES